MAASVSCERRKGPQYTPPDRVAKRQMAAETQGPFYAQVVDSALTRVFVASGYPDVCLTPLESIRVLDEEHNGGESTWSPSRPEPGNCTIGHKRPRKKPTGASISRPRRNTKIKLINTSRRGEESFAGKLKTSPKSLFFIRS